MSDKSHAFNWAESVRLLCKNPGDGSLHLKVREFLRNSECKRVLVACSGGADSVFMFCLLWANSEALGIQLIVAHYNHHWRGADAEQDAKFVEEMSRQLGCSFVLGERAKNESATTETSARSLRISFLRAAAKKHGCQCIAFGHQQDDILETQLQRLARGSGTDGLAAPRPVHLFEAYPTHIRPLLHLRTGTIREALQKSSIPWCEDSSNKNVGIPRNALRHSVIPSLQDALEHNVSKGAARSRKLLEEDAVALDQLARESLPEAFGGSELLELAALRVAPRALTRRALIAWLSVHDLSASLSAAAVDQLIDAIYARKKTFRLSAGAFFIEVDAATVRIESIDLLDTLLQPCTVRAGESVALSTDALLETKIVPVDEVLRQRLSEGTVDVTCEAYIALGSEQIFQIRARRPGDSFRPLGAPGTKKLKDWFIDRHVPARERNRLPLVLTDSGVVVWVPGLPPADDLKINATTKTALKLTYKTRKTTLSA
ncbi:MAG: tRNA(Ile)-lysidine synthase [Lentimonas sp.]|jgi:tRNA(Ile)-lysidine synthase